MHVFKRIAAALLLVITFPFLLFIYAVIKLTSKGPGIFRQKRSGINKKPFILFKFRSMVYNAEQLKKKYRHLNETDGPVFKIKDDPRYTKIGKVLSHLGLDEIPQLINIMKGEMDFVGPRPLPITEANKIPKKYDLRFSVLPGVTSTWIINGAHNLTFDQWMKLDVNYVKQKSLINDLTIFLKTLDFIAKLAKNKFYKLNQALI